MNKYPMNTPEIIIAEALKKKFRGFKRPVIIAVGGPGGAGKTSFALRLSEKLPHAAILSLDDYKTSRKERAEKNLFGAHPEANDMVLIRRHLKILRSGLPVQKPLYCRERGSRHLTEALSPGEFVIAEGETAAYKYFEFVIDFSIFIDASLETQLNTRFTRDIIERGYSPQKAGAAFTYSNLMEFREHGACGRDRADVCMLCAEDYTFSIEKVSAENIPHFPAGKEKQIPGTS